MRTTDTAARAIQRGNMITMGLYVAVAAILAPRFQSWPRDLVSGDSAASAPDGVVGRLMLAHPSAVWIAIPLTLLVTNTLAIAVGDRGNLFRSVAASSTPPNIRAARARASAWLGCAMTTFTIFVSTLFYAGWDAVAQRNPQIFWRGITVGAAILTPISAAFVGLTAWNARRAFQLERTNSNSHIQGSSAVGP